jgi:hypothetical protein
VSRGVTTIDEHTSFLHKDNNPELFKQIHPTKNKFDINKLEFKNGVKFIYDSLNFGINYNILIIRRFMFNF